MKLKAIFALTLAALMTASAFAGCTQKEDSNGNSSSGSSNPASDLVSDVASGADKLKTGLLSSVHTALKELYGEAYVANMAVEKDQIENVFGVPSDLVRDVIAETPLMNVHVDTFVGIEAVEGKGEEVEKLMNAYRDKLVKEKEEVPYLPVHLPKTRASQVVRVDDYVFFVMLGDIPDDLEEDQMEAKTKEEVQRGVDKIHEVLGK